MPRRKYPPMMPTPQFETSPAWGNPYVLSPDMNRYVRDRVTKRGYFLPYGTVYDEGEVAPAWRNPYGLEPKYRRFIRARPADRPDMLPRGTVLVPATSDKPLTMTSYPTRGSGLSGLGDDVGAPSGRATQAQWDAYYATLPVGTVCGTVGGRPLTIQVVDGKKVCRVTGPTVAAGPAEGTACTTAGVNGQPGGVGKWVRGDGGKLVCSAGAWSDFYAPTDNRLVKLDKRTGKFILVRDERSSAYWHGVAMDRLKKDFPGWQVTKIINQASGNPNDTRTQKAIEFKKQYYGEKPYSKIDFVGIDWGEYRDARTGKYEMKPIPSRRWIGTWLWDNLVDVGKWVWNTAENVLSLIGNLACSQLVSESAKIGARAALASKGVSPETSNGVLDYAQTKLCSGRGGDSIDTAIVDSGNGRLLLFGGAALLGLYLIS